MNVGLVAWCFSKGSNARKYICQLNWGKILRLQHINTISIHFPALVLLPNRFSRGVLLYCPIKPTTILYFESPLEGLSIIEVWFFEAMELALALALMLALKVERGGDFNFAIMIELIRYGFGLKVIALQGIPLFLHTSFHLLDADLGQTEKFLHYFRKNIYIISFRIAFSIINPSDEGKEEEQSARV